jgi:hypothetical protein
MLSLPVGELNAIAFNVTEGVVVLDLEEVEFPPHPNQTVKSASRAHEQKKRRLREFKVNPPNAVFSVLRTVTGMRYCGKSTEVTLVQEL